MAVFGRRAARLRAVHLAVILGASHQGVYAGLAAFARKNIADHRVRPACPVTPPMSDSAPDSTESAPERPGLTRRNQSSTDALPSRRNTRSTNVKRAVTYNSISIMQMTN